jgi:hypothetical protein
MDAGCGLLAIDEFGDEPQRWEGTPMQGLPYYLLLGRPQEIASPPNQSNKTPADSPQ